MGEAQDPEVLVDLSQHLHIIGVSFPVMTITMIPFLRFVLNNSRRFGNTQKCSLHST